MEQHFDRWHHQVDYSPFKGNAPILKRGITPTHNVNEYGLTLMRTTARLLDLAVQAGWLSPESGVYILRTGINPEYPSAFTAGRITKLIPGQSEDRFTVDEIGIQQLMSGQPITTNARQLTL